MTYILTSKNDILGPFYVFCFRRSLSINDDTFAVASGTSRKARGSWVNTVYGEVVYFYLYIFYKAELNFLI